MDYIANKILLISVMALPFLLAVTLHEYGHAYVAHKVGDESQRYSGRLSLNPLVHIDPFGTVILPIAAMLAGLPFLFGYAKPVMVQARYFKRPRLDNIMVALAGPFGNILVAIFFCYVLRIALAFDYARDDWVVLMAFYGIYLNCLFAIFNLLPIPPLDGSHIVEQMLPAQMRGQYRKIAPYGFFVLIAILIVANNIILVPTRFLTQAIMALTNVSI